MNADANVSVDHGGLVVDVLGAGSGYPTAVRDTSSLLIGSVEGWTVVDCPGSLVHKLAARALPLGALRRIILTHDHVDHVYGLPHLIQALAIEGRADEVHLLAPGQALATVEGMLRVHNLIGDRYPEVRQTEIPMVEATEVLRTEDLRISASPTEHTRDTVALRFETAAAAVCYSSDTRPSEAVTRLAAEVDILLHDCAGPHRLRDTFSGSHSSALEAARVAAAAGARKLVLTHLGARDDDVLKECRAEAEAEFGGPVDLALDGTRWTVPSHAGDDG